MSTNLHRAVIVVGREGPSEATLAQAEQYDEVFVIARAVPNPSARWVIDDDRSRDEARERLNCVLGKLRERGVHARGGVGDASATAARDDAAALFPAAHTLATP
jgi:hypothetical protein